MTTTMNCPQCDAECDRNEVDIGVGVQYGPFGCMCGWSQDPRYDSRNGACVAEVEQPDWLIDTRGGMMRR